MASGVDAMPIRFVSTLAPGQRLVISVPQAVDKPSVDFEIVRNGDLVLVTEPAAAADPNPNPSPR